jgi:lipid A ethanolaminephosphotransferase
MNTKQVKAFKLSSISANTLLLVISIYLTFVLNAPFLYNAYQAITETPEYSTSFLVCFPLFFLALIAFIQGLVSIKPILKPTLILTVMISSVLFYARVNYSTVFDYSMMQNAFETDTAEALSYLNPQLVFYIFLFGIVPAIYIYKVPVTYGSFWNESVKRFKYLSINGVILFMLGSMYYPNFAAVGRNHEHLIDLITPHKMLDSSYRYVKNSYFYPAKPLELLDSHPKLERHSSNKHITVVLLGETARAENFSLNGYSRHTNRYTQGQNIVSFKHVNSCGTATAISVPCMFSRLSKSDYNKYEATYQQNVLDIINKAGVEVTWISNNNGSCKDVCNRIPFNQLPTDASHPLCDGDYCYDEVLVNALEERLNQTSDRDAVIVLHMIGSHGPTYFKRYPQSHRIFTPDCQRSDIQNCTREQLTNSYDNTIAYSDYVISQVISLLQRYSDKDATDTSLIYISDHGESLGEGGVYLHGMPYAIAPKQQKTVPMLVWSNENELDVDCLESRAQRPISQDNFFDTLLGMSHVKSVTYNFNQDVFGTCTHKGA